MMMTRNRSLRGFTLVELAIVVTIVGVLATLAIYGMNRYLQYTKTAEATEMIGAIKAGQEAYYDETHRYLSADPSATPSPDAFYPDSPANADGSIKIQWGGDAGGVCPGCVDRYRILGVMPSAPVLFRYSTTASNLGGDPSSSSFVPSAVTGTFFAGATGNREFFVVFALTDLNGDDDPYTTFAGSSFTQEIASENIGQ